MDSVQVAIGVFDGKVVAKWPSACDQIVFDAKNSYLIGMALCKAALEANRGRADKGDTEFIAGELTERKMVITELQRDALIGQVATQIRTLVNKHASAGTIAMHAVDTVLQETTR